MFDTIIYGNVTLWDIFLSTLIIIIATIIAKGIAMNIRRTLKDKVDRGNMEVVIKVVYLIFIGIALIMILPDLGIDPTGLMVTGGIIGLVIAFASQSIVSNFISGIFLIFERPIKIGDTITIDKNTGVVEDIHILSTSLRTFDGLYVRIPNEKVFTSEITNLVAYQARRYDYTIGIRETDDPDKAISLINQIIEEEVFILKKPEPTVFVHNLDNSSINIAIRFWCPVTELHPVRMRFILTMKKSLEENDIFTSSPKREVSFSNSLNTTGTEPFR